MMSLAKAHVIGYSHGQSLHERITMVYYLLPPVNDQQADMYSFRNQNSNN